MLSRTSILHHAFILLIALLAGHYIVSHNTALSWFALLKRGYYYWSVLPSMFIAVTLMEYVFWITKRLNKQDDGFKINRERVKNQLIFGFAGTMGLEVCLAALLFFLKGESIFNGPYFAKLFLLVTLFVLLVNLCYCLYYAKMELAKPQPAPVINIIEKVKFKYKQYKPEVVPETTSVLPTMGIVYIKHKAPLAYDARGEMIPWTFNLTETIEMMPADDYFQIDKKCIISRAVVRETAPRKGNRLDIYTTVEFPIKLTVSRRKTKDFKDWLYGKMEDQA